MYVRLEAQTMSICTYMRFLDRRCRSRPGGEGARYDSKRLFSVALRMLIHPHQEDYLPNPFNGPHSSNVSLPTIPTDDDEGSDSGLEDPFDGSSPVQGYDVGF